MSNIPQAQQQETNEENSSEKKDFTEKFSDERRSWSDVVITIGKRFREVENLAEVQVDLYSRRQEAIEYQYKLIGIHSKLKHMLSAQWKRAFDEAGRNEDLRYSDKDKSKVADAATANIRYKVESVNSQIEFFRETVKSIDTMTFGVKHRIEIENFKAGMK
jgi:hypothetical protein